VYRLVSDLTMTPFLGPTFVPPIRYSAYCLNVTLDAKNRNVKENLVVFLAVNFRKIFKNRNVKVRNVKASLTFQSGELILTL